MINGFSCPAVSVALADGVEWSCGAVLVSAVITLVAGAGEVLAVLAGGADAREECRSVHNRFA